MVPVAHLDLLIAVDGVDDPAGYHRKIMRSVLVLVTYETAAPAISKTVDWFEAEGRKAERPLVVDSCE